MPGRMTGVHCMDVPSGNSGCDHLRDFPGDIIRMHERLGFRYVARYCVWKEPLGVRNRTMAKNLAHKTIVDDSSRCSVASADYLLMFRRKGDNPVPIKHPVGLLEYAGERQPPADLLRYRGWKGLDAPVDNVELQRVNVLLVVRVSRLAVREHPVDPHVVPERASVAPPDPVRVTVLGLLALPGRREARSPVGARRY